MTKDEANALVVLGMKIESLIESHDELKREVRGVSSCLAINDKAIAVLNEQHGTLKERVNSWSLLNSIGVVVVAIGTALAAIFGGE